MKALIIEDDIHSARVLSHLLKKQNIESAIVIDVNQLGEYRSMKPDIVFVDLEMPQINGFEVLEVLLQESHYGSIPIVASSIHTSQINQVRQAGFHSFIGKPLGKDNFPKQLNRILSGERVWEFS